MNKYTLTILTGLSVLYVISLYILDINIKWYICLIIYIVASYFGRALYVAKEGFNITYLSHTGNDINGYTTFTIYVHTGSAQYEINGNFYNEHNISEQHLKILLYKDTKQKEVIPLLINNRKAHKKYVFKGNEFQVNFESINLL